MESIAAEVSSFRDTVVAKSLMDSVNGGKYGGGGGGGGRY